MNKTLCMVLSSPPPDSPSYNDAIIGPDKHKWAVAIAKEYEALFTNDTFSQPMDLPQGRKAIDTKMVLKIKEPEAIGEEGRYKARLCGKGFQQVYMVNYFETFAPVATYDYFSLLWPY